MDWLDRWFFIAMILGVAFGSSLSDEATRRQLEEIKKECVHWEEVGR